MKTLLIGVGAAGNKAVLDVVNQNVTGITKDDIVLINSTSKDIPAEFEGTTVILSPDDSGCGKERGIAKEYVLEAIQSGKMELSKQAENYEAVIVVTSLEGGTGSGAAPIIAKYCDEMIGKNTHLIGFTGFEEDVRGLQNTVEFFQEVSETIMVQCIQNKLFLKQAGNSKFKAEKLANLELARRIGIINGSLLKNSSQNIDDTDIYKVTNTNGYMTAEYCEVGESLVDTADFDKICKKMIYDSKSLRCPQGQSRMAVIMNLSPASEDAIDSSFRVLKDTYGIPYECFMHKEYDTDMPEFIAFISSGMKMPLEEVKAIYEKYKEESEKVNKSTDSFFDEMKSIAKTGNLGDKKFNSGRPKEKQTVGMDNFLKQFETRPKEPSKK